MTQMSTHRELEMISDKSYSSCLFHSHVASEEISVDAAYPRERNPFARRELADLLLFQEICDKILAVISRGPLDETLKEHGWVA